MKKFFLWVIAVLHWSWFTRWIAVLLFRVANRRMRSELTPREFTVFENLVSCTIPYTGRRHEMQRVFALIGLVGVGKSTVARLIADRFGAIVISSNEIRMALHGSGIGFTEENVRIITRFLLDQCLLRGYSVVLDSDHVHPWKQIEVREWVDGRAVVSFVRVVMSDVLTQRDRILLTDPGLLFLRDNKSLAKAREWKLKEFERQFSLHYSRIGKLRELSFSGDTIKNDGTLEDLATAVKCFLR